MAHTPANSRFSRSQAIAIALLLFTTTLVILGCGHSSASNQTPAIPMSTVMDAIQQYGKGSSYATAAPAPPTPRPLSFTDSRLDNIPEQSFESLMKSLLINQAFEYLETIADNARSQKSRHSGGVWVIDDFYTYVSTPIAKHPTPALWDEHIALLNKWVAAYPQSSTSRIALAGAYVERAWDARGEGYANSVSDSSWATFNAYNNLAKTALMEAATMKDKDPYWYELMFQLALAEGWSPEQERELFQQSSSFEPTYYHYHRRHTLYLLPRWHGADGEMESFAEETLKRLKEPTASMMYFDVVSAYATGVFDDPTSLHGASWPKLKEGYANIVRLYGASTTKANRYAYLAFVANDKAAAALGFTQMGEAYERNSWKNRLQYETARAWATAP